MVLELGHIAGHVYGGHRSERRRLRSPSVTNEALLEVLRAAAGAVRGALDALEDWGPAGESATHAGQYHSDVAADAAAVAVLEGAGLGVLSEESGLHSGDREVVVALDP